MKSVIHFIDTITVGKVLTLLLTPFIATMTSAAPLIVGLGIIITLDFLTGIRKSLFEKNIKSPFTKVFWETVSSSGFRRTWRKSTEYAVGILVFSILNTFFKIQFELPWLSTNMVETIILTAIVIESYSIYENLRDSSKNSKPVKLFKFLLDLFTSKLPEIFKKTLKNN